MKRYRVALRVSGLAFYEVDAEGKDEARVRAMEVQSQDWPELDEVEEVVPRHVEEIARPAYELDEGDDE